MRTADRLVLQTVRRGGPWLSVLAVTSVVGALAELALPSSWAGRSTVSSRPTPAADPGSAPAPSS
ncbi:hypothetical protein ACFQX6_63545 [Streptosporangium lutulentum]